MNLYEDQLLTVSCITMIIVGNKIIKLVIRTYKYVVIQHVVRCSGMII